MDLVTILLGGALLIAVLLFLRADNKKEKEIARRVNKLHGPTSIPILGTAYFALFLKREGEKFCSRSLTASRIHVVVVRI